MAVWRALRKSGAALVATGVWTAPDLPAFTDHMPKIHELARSGGGNLMVFRTLEDGDRSRMSLRAAFASAHREHITELKRGCERLDTEVADATAAQHFTVVALDAVELSLARLQRRHRSLAARDVLGLIETQHATDRMHQSEDEVAAFRERVRMANDVAP